VKKKTESLNIGVYFDYSDPLSNQVVWGCWGGGVNVLGNTALHKLSIRKTGLRESGFLRHPSPRFPSLKIHTVLDIKPLH
jgi:hypothetical protein